MKHTFCLFYFILTFIGCKDKPAPIEPTTSNDLSGKITLCADNGTVFQDNSGVHVSIEADSISTITSSDGSWKLSNVPVRDYTNRLVFSKAGFLTRKTYFYDPKIGFFTLNNLPLAQIPSVSVTELHISRPDEGGNLQIKGKISSADSCRRDVGIIYSLSPISISSTVGFVSEYGAFLLPDSVTFSLKLQYYDQYVTSNGIASRGSTVYFRAYAKPRAPGYPNYNQLTGLYEIDTPGPLFSNLDSVIVY